jgi:molybdopterin converting factor subunit 1
MKVRVRLFAFMAQAAGTREVEVELAAGATLSDLQRVMRDQRPEVRWPREVMWAINQEYAPGVESPLNDGDEVAIIPPVSGG